MSAVLALRDVHVRFNTAAGVVRAVNGVSLDLAVGETLGLVGESGCGKSTLGKAIMRLVPAERRRDRDRRASTSRRCGARARRDAPQGADDLPGPLRLAQSALDGRPQRRPAAGASPAGSRPPATERVDTLLRWVGLPADARQRYPHEFSGGQRQRIGIARALALSPKLIICDEPVSALDVSVHAQVINLLEDLKQQFGVSYLFISHDLAVVEHIADRVAVMYLGTIVEAGGRDQIWRRPQHPYTKALLEAAPVANPEARPRPQANRAARRAAEPARAAGRLPLPFALPDRAGALQIGPAAAAAC